MYLQPIFCFTIKLSILAVVKNNHGKYFNLLLASRLYNLRRQSNLKQPELAERLHISQQAYSKLERGTTQFSDEVIDTISRFFNIPVKEFTNFNDKVHCNNSPNSANINSHINSTKFFEEVASSIIKEMEHNREERKILLNFIKNEADSRQNERDYFMGLLKGFSVKNNK